MDATEVNSTSQVTFYKIQGETLTDKLNFSCRLAERGVSLGCSVFILAESHEQLVELDEKLWTFSATSFIPHRFQSAKTSEDLVTVGNELPSSDHNDVLINLRNISFANPNQFSRITEIIIQDESHITLARKRYRSYQEAGLKPMMVSI